MSESEREEVLLDIESEREEVLRLRVEQTRHVAVMAQLAMAWVNEAHRIDPPGERAGGVPPLRRANAAILRNCGRQLLRALVEDVEGSQQWPA